MTTGQTTGALRRSIGVTTDVKDLADLLAGARLDQARLETAEGRLQMVLDLTRAMSERHATVRQGLARRVKTPWTRSRLVFRAVKGATIKRLEDVSPDQFPLLSTEAVPGGYRLTVTAPDGLQLLLDLDKLEGQFSDVGSPIEAP